MNWKLILLLSLFGLAMGLATVSLIPSTIEPFFWLVIFVICAYIIATYAPGKFFLHGLLVSIVNGVWVTLAHASMFYTYISTHPEYMQMVEGLPPTLSGHPRRLMFLIGPITGVMFGLVLGLFAWIASRLFRRSMQ
jgi:hypothetical protein